MPKKDQKETENLSQYEDMYNKLSDYEENIHKKNQKRIRIGLRCVVIIPLFFMFLLFLTNSNKVIFLILWIVSLFAISAYLIFVEYTDYQLQEKMNLVANRDKEVSHLLSEDVDQFEEKIRIAKEQAKDLIGNALTELSSASETKSVKLIEEVQIDETKENEAEELLTKEDVTEEDEIEENVTEEIETIIEEVKVKEKDKKDKDKKKASKKDKSKAKNKDKKKANNKKDKNKKDKKDKDKKKHKKGDK